MIQNPTGQNDLPAKIQPSDEWLFGWDNMPRIVSVWADRSGRALIWQRDPQTNLVQCHEDRFRPWMITAHLDDLKHLGPNLVNVTSTKNVASFFNYRELASTSTGDTLRYLISAQDGHALNQAMLVGAEKRLKQPVKSLRELPNEDYYWMGPVEQYLMLTGRVYYRGMTYQEVHRLQFDLETTGLSPKTSRIFMVAVKDSLGLETMLEAPTEQDEAQLIRDLCTLIRQRNPDVIENHNLFGFDLPFLEERARVLGVPLQLARAEAPGQLLEKYEEPAGWGHGKHFRYSLTGRELIDTLDAVRRHDFVARTMTEGYGLKAVARHFGFASPDRTYIPGAEIYTTYQRDPDRVRRYAFDDVREVDGLSQHLMGAPFALSGMAPRRYERVASAGPATGLLEPILVRAYLRAGYAIPRNASIKESEMAPHQGGATILYTAGVARNVVKADIASMYPSIMRSFRIGPECDPLEAMLYLVDRLTDLRLKHKRALKNADPNSVEWQQHNALQAAMKLVINSAYGYMAAGKMALFADRHAADEVTRLGREILSQVSQELQNHGLVLMEADTDGVFFTVPADWDEQHERDCVAEVAATLPRGLNLEYEGRYKAMLSHEVKNYALLTYDDQLIIRGNAFHSSRSEPFGEQFLKEALGLTLIGDTEGLRDLYLRTVTALQERRLSPKEVAIVARLTKTYEQYQEKRKRIREAPYEALIAAGRTGWRVGERVRFYRAEGNQAVWIHDEPDRDEVSRPEETRQTKHTAPKLPPYDIANYLTVLQTSYVSRLRKAFEAEDFEQLFRVSGQIGLFDKPFSQMQPQWIQIKS